MLLRMVAGVMLPAGLLQRAASTLLPARVEPEIGCLYLHTLLHGSSEQDARGTRDYCRLGHGIQSAA